MQKQRKLFNSRRTTIKRRNLRSEMTKSEELVWRMVRNNHLGFKFRRQYGIGGFIVDFCCPALKLVVEIDGETHYNDFRFVKDHERQKYIENLGFTVKRYPADYVLDNPERVYDDLKSVLSTLTLPSPWKGEGTI